MFATLPESAARRQKRGTGLLVSAALHAMLIGLAVYATARSETPRPRLPRPDVIYFIPPPAPALPTSPPSSGPSAASSLVEAPPTDRLIAPIDIPDLIPPSLGGDDLVAREDFAGTPVGPIVPGSAGTGVPGSNVAGGDALDARVVDRQVVARAGNPTPRYPSVLQSAGVEGSVRMRFIVDTLGRVEPASILALASTHTLFEHAVRESLLRSRFTPAEAAGRRVRQLVEQSFQFETVDRRD